MELPQPRITFEFGNAHDAKQACDEIERQAEGLLDVRRTEREEEYWPGRFTTVHVVSMIPKAKIELSQLIELLNQYR